MSELTRALEERISALEERVASLEQQLPHARRSAGADGSRDAGAAGRTGGRTGGFVAARASVSSPAAADWVEPYEVADLELDQTWIEMHEPSARRQLHRLICEAVKAEGPVTEQLVLRRVREAWGLKRAGARIQEVFDQAVRQLVFTERLERLPNETLRTGEQQLWRVRVPADDDATRRSVEEVPAGELELALLLTARDAGAVSRDELTMRVSKLFGWTRRGTGIQTALDARVDALLQRGELEQDGSTITAVQHSDL